MGMAYLVVLGCDRSDTSENTFFVSSAVLEKRKEHLRNRDKVLAYKRVNDTDKIAITGHNVELGNGRVFALRTERVVRQDPFVDAHVFGNLSIQLPALRDNKLAPRYEEYHCGSEAVIAFWSSGEVYTLGFPCIAYCSRGTIRLWHADDDAFSVQVNMHMASRTPYVGKGECDDFIINKTYKLHLTSLDWKNK